MGLDMYLTKKSYIDNDFDKRKIKGQLIINNKTVDINFNAVNCIAENVGYWKKANQIHNWFVKNVQHNVNNCAEYFVSKKQLKTLLKICKQILKNKKLAPKLLPYSPGFLFNVDYDQNYFKNIKHTISILKSLDLKNNKINSIIKTHYYYSSSW